MSWTFCTSGAAIAKAGADANSTIVASGSALANWSDEAESYICAVARNDLVTNFSSMTANGKQILQMLCSAMIAQKIILYKVDAYSSSRTDETMLDILQNDVNRGVELIKDDKTRAYLSL